MIEASEATGTGHGNRVASHAKSKCTACASGSKRTSATFHRAPIPSAAVNNAFIGSLIPLHDDKSIVFHTRCDKPAKNSPIDIAGAARK